MKYQNYKKYENNRSSDGRFHYLYKITNLINGKYYYGVHSTYYLGDGYWGSGVLIKKAIQKYGKNNFSKEFIEFFSNEKDMYEKEKKFIDESIVNDPQSYNLMEGGLGNECGYILGKFKDTGEFIKIKKDDPRWGSQEVISVNSGFHPVYDNELKKYRRVTLDELEGNKNLSPIFQGTIMVYDIIDKIYKRVDVNDPDRKNGRYISPSKGKVTVKDTLTDKYVQIDKDVYYSNKSRYIHSMKGRLTLRDKETGVCKSFNKDDLIDWNKYEYVTKGHNVTNKGKILVWNNDHSVIKWIDKSDPDYISGKLFSVGRGNKSTKGKVCVTNKHKNKLIDPKDVENFLRNNPEWERGGSRKYKINITDGVNNKSIYKEQLSLWESKGWRQGQVQNKPNKKK